MLNSGDLVKGLDDYLKSPVYKCMLAGTIFNKADAELWFFVINRVDFYAYHSVSSTVYCVYPNVS